MVEQYLGPIGSLIITPPPPPPRITPYDHGRHANESPSRLLIGYM